jgi:hypothetical protein
MAEPNTRFPRRFASLFTLGRSYPDGWYTLVCYWDYRGAREPMGYWRRTRLLYAIQSLHGPIMTLVG